MAKQPHHAPPEKSSNATLAIMAIGALLVAGLVAWALTRTVDRGPSDSVMETATATPATVDTSSFVAQDTAATVPPATAAPGDIVTSTHAQPQGDKSEVQRISAEDLRDKMKLGTVVVVDTRDAMAYEGSHIQGAINIPMASIEANLDRLPKDKEIVAYCT